MKKWLGVIGLATLSCVCISSFSAFPPSPQPGTSCKATYNPTTDLSDFCGCYQEEQANNCTLLEQPINCNGDPDGLVFQTYSAIRTLYGGNLTTFCNAEVGQLHAHGNTAVTVQNCEDDIGEVIDSLKGENSLCTGHWENSTVQ